MFLGSQDIQLGVNESLLDTSIVVSSMVDGIMARVNGHEEVEVGFFFFFPGCLLLLQVNPADIPNPFPRP